MADSPPTAPLISLLTDFGMTDPYVGVMKAVVLSRCRTARLVDLTHAVGSHDVASAAEVLRSCYRYFPPGTVHLAVVDPGVGTERRALAARADGYFFVAPDNGLLSPVLEEAGRKTVVSVRAEELFLTPLSNTFHGRDLFAPIAAALAGGIALDELGERIDDWRRLEQPRPSRQPDGSLVGQVIGVDHFGNLLTNLPGPELPMFPVIELAGRTIEGLCRFYDQCEPGRLMAIIGSTGRLEIAVNRGRAADRFDTAAGLPVSVRPGRSNQRPGGKDRRA